MKLKPLLLTALLPALLMGVPLTGSATEGKVTVECGDTRYLISTGSGTGDCLGSMGDGTSLNCDDGNGNTASADCGSGCSGQTGTGSCEKIVTPPPPPPAPILPEGSVPQGSVPEGSVPVVPQNNSY